MYFDGDANPSDYQSIRMLTNRVGSLTKRLGCMHYLRERTVGTWGKRFVKQWPQQPRERSQICGVTT